MREIFHVDTQFLTSSLNIFENPGQFEQAARSSDPRLRAANVANLVDALDLCNMLVLGDRVVFDGNVGGGRQQRILDQIDRVARSLRDSSVSDLLRGTFGSVAPTSSSVSKSMRLEAAKAATAFFPRLARCATNVLDLFHLPHSAPTDPGRNLIQYIKKAKMPSALEIEEIEARKEITGRRFYAAMLENETAFKALCDAQQRIPMTEDVLAVLFMNFRLRLAEQRSLSREKVLIGGNLDSTVLPDDLTYLPSMGRRDFTREFSQFVRWGTDPKSRNGHVFDLGIREYVLEEWEGVGCQMQLSERRAIPIVVASVLGTKQLKESPTPQNLLVECLRWKRENQGTISDIRRATNDFVALEDEARKSLATQYVAEILKSPSTESARIRSLADQLSMKDKWMGFTVRAMINPLGTLENVVIGSTDKVREHIQKVESKEFRVATHLSEAARPVLAGVGPELRQRMIDVFGGAVLDARNPRYDPDRFPAAA